MRHGYVDHATIRKCQHDCPHWWMIEDSARDEDIGAIDEFRGLQGRHTSCDIGRQVTQPGSFVRRGTITAQAVFINAFADCGFMPTRLRGDCAQ